MVAVQEPSQQCQGWWQQSRKTVPVTLSQDFNGAQPPLVSAHFLSSALQALSVVSYLIVFLGNSCAISGSLIWFPELAPEYPE